MEIIEDHSHMDREEEGKWKEKNTVLLLIKSTYSSNRALGIFKIIEFLKFPTGCVMIFPLNYGNKDNYYHY